MAGVLGVGVPRKGPTKVPTPPMRAALVLGSRPPSMRSGEVPKPGLRIKPGPANTTQYGKAVGQANPAGVTSQWPGVM
jgi:hypothetical protein